MTKASDRPSDTGNHYVLVVHGIGRQRKNETVLSVISRFAEARRLRWNEAPDDSLPVDIVTLGMATGQSDFGAQSSSRPWLEFEGIPIKWRADPESPEDPVPGPHFDGSVPSSSGENLRFVDVNWSSQLARDFEKVGDRSPERWGATLMSRLARKGGSPSPTWAMQLLRLLRETVILVRRLLFFRGQKEISKLVFNEFLGDVQVYGEHPRTRGRAVGEFHRLIERIHENDKAATFTIIAHSLGSVLAFDALMYAALEPSYRKSRETGTNNLPFPGYIEGVAETHTDRQRFTDGIECHWIKRVRSLVTLGSPIDKFLVLWWNNYLYLTDEKAFHEFEFPIEHFNYCDEQDPVGHKLDLDLLNTKWVSSAPAAVA